MSKKEHIVRYTDEEIESMKAQGKSKSDWTKAASMMHAEIEAAIEDDPDETGMVVDWSQVTAELPQPKAVLNMRLDSDVLEFFRSQGKGYQTRINAVLRSYVEQMQHQNKR